MGKTYLTCRGKIQKLKEENGVSNGVRNIGDLPEAILVYILSFLRMRDAVRTSVLSKHWQFLWTSIPNLSFDEFKWRRSCPNCDSKLFMDLIDKVLLLHSPASIEVFTLTYIILRCEDRSRFNGWISNVLRHNVRDFTLYLGRVEESKSFWLPPGFFTCDTLVRLSLGFRHTTALNLPSQVHLPNLKVLFLDNVRFLDGCSTQQLLSSSALEILHVDRCNLEKIPAVSISAPKLKYLAIIEHVQDPLYDDELWNGQESPRCQVTICNCDLVSLDLSGRIVNEYSTCNLSAAFVDLSIEFEIKKEAVRHLNRILHGISAVYKLTIGQGIIESVEEKPELIFRSWSDMPIFSTLGTLQLGYFEMINALFGKILQSIPYLHTLQLHKGIYYPYHIHGEDIEIFDPVPACFLSSLKEIIVDCLFLNEGELYVFKTMLKHAMVLEEFVISDEAAHIKEHKRWDSFSQKLMACPRGSKDCKIIL